MIKRSQNCKTPMMKRLLVLRLWDWAYLATICSWLSLAYYQAVVMHDIPGSAVSCIAAIIFMFGRLATTEWVMFFWLWLSLCVNLLCWSSIAVRQYLEPGIARKILMLAVVVIGVYLAFAIGGYLGSKIGCITSRVCDEEEKQSE